MTTTTVAEQVKEIELGFWKSSNDPKYFEQNMDDHALAVMEPMGFIPKREAVHMAKEDGGWEDIAMHDVHITQLTADCTTIAYHGEARSAKTGEPYRASINSVYVLREGRWLLGMTAHQPWSENHENPRD